MNYIYLLVVTTFWNGAPVLDECKPQPSTGEVVAGSLKGTVSKSSATKSVEIAGYYKTDDGCTKELAKRTHSEAIAQARIIKSGVKPAVTAREFECTHQKLES